MTAAPGKTSPDSFSAVSARAHHLELFKVSGGTLQHRWWTVDEQHWTPWHPLDAPSDLTAVAATAHTDDSITIFVLTRPGQIHVRWWSLQDEWGDWESLGGPVYPPIAATSLRYGHIEVYAYSGDNTLVSRYLTAEEEPWAWTEWQAFEDTMG